MSGYIPDLRKSWLRIALGRRVRNRLAACVQPAITAYRAPGPVSLETGTWMNLIDAIMPGKDTPQQFLVAKDYYLNLFEPALRLACSDLRPEIRLRQATDYPMVPLSPLGVQKFEPRGSQSLPHDFLR